ncbi:MAG: ketoacyl-ACP synthase III [Lachnospiraceae bacterium]|nr:ketoacyl-ACP synthase III [Lachnospiraceae bacterium]
MFGRICGTGSYTPNMVWDNDKLAEMVETNDAWIRERTGVARRHIAKDETASFMAVKAAQEAIKNAGIDPEAVDLIIAATISSEVIMPSLSCMVQARLGADKAFCFDLNAACTGFLFALNTAQAYLSLGIYKTAIVIGTECLSNLVDWQDRGTCILFGDGAGAVVIRAEEQTLYSQVSHSDGEKGQVLTCQSRNQRKLELCPKAEETYIRMDGGAVFKFAVSKVPEVIHELMNQPENAEVEVDYYLLHQANERIVRSVAKRLKEPLEKFPMNMEEYGNTSSASIPILLDEMNKKGMLKRGQKLVLSGFGGGLSYGASLLTW